MKEKRKCLLVCMLLLILPVIIPVAGAMAGDWQKIDDSSWCNKKWSFRSDTACEVRELNINKAWKKISVDASPNGDIKVEGWDKDSIRIQARVQAKARSQEKAEELISEIDIDADRGKIHADGPTAIFSKQSWSVSYRLMVPVKSNLHLTALNGGISIIDIDGQIKAKTLNGGIALKNLAGDVEVKTLNGGITAELDGDRWKGRGLEAKTTNGGIKVKIPENYSASLSAGTVNGGIHVDFPITVRGWIRKSIDTTLGKGGAPVRLKTVNGGVSIEKK